MSPGMSRGMQRHPDTLPAFLTAAKGYRGVGPFANTNAFPRQHREKHPAHRALYGNRTDAQHEGQCKSSLQMSTCHLWILMRADQQLKCIHAPLVIRETRCRRRAHTTALGGISGSAGPEEVW